MSRKDELLKLAQVFHSQARRAETPGVKQTLHRMGQYYQNEAPMRRIAAPNDNGNSGSSIATPSRLHRRAGGPTQGLRPGIFWRHPSSPYRNVKGYATKLALHVAVIGE